MNLIKTQIREKFLNKLWLDYLKKLEEKYEFIKSENPDLIFSTEEIYKNKEKIWYMQLVWNETILFKLFDDFWDFRKDMTNLVWGKNVIIRWDSCYEVNFF